MRTSQHKISENSDSVGQPLEAISEAIRDRIDAARVVCVLLMMYVHVPGGQPSGSGAQTAVSTRIDHWLESILVEGPGRASAALLSVVSGYLIVHTLTYRNTPVINVYKRRFVAIIVPMFFWALLTCLVYLVLDQSHGSFIGSAHHWYDKLNLVLFIFEAPYGPTLHLAFLRDLFVCVLLSPLLLMALKRLPQFTMALFGVLYLFEHSGQLYIILRPLIILGFATGMLLALRRVRTDALDQYWAFFLSLTGVFAVLIVWAHAGLLRPVETYLAASGISLKESVLYPLCRLFGSLAIWCILPMWRSAKFKRLINCLSPYLFVAFCSHFLVLTLLFNGLWLPLVGDRDSYLFFVWFMCAPLVAMGASMVMVSIAARIYAPLVTLITGGRIQSDDMPADARGNHLRAT